MKIVASSVLAGWNVLHRHSQVLLLIPLPPVPALPCPWGLYFLIFRRAALRHPKHNQLLVWLVVFFEAEVYEVSLLFPVTYALGGSRVY